ncbi:MAG: rubrerythrin family protein [Desulfobulbaceae bacterium A2]|nr:MAG: rubrerythrin family protein [Desulfobulbaceae bacterium A2]
MSTFKGSRTEKNLLTAFAGESQARNRYTFFAKQAKKEGFEQISAIFTRTAEQELAHAKRLFSSLQGGEVEVAACFPAGVIGSTAENLEAAAQGEEYEYNIMYPDFARIAREESLEEIAALFNAIAVAERQHGKQYRDFLANIQAERVFKREQAQAWYCRHCGYVHQGGGPPAKCPACAHPTAYYELLAENW